MVNLERRVKTLEKQQEGRPRTFNANSFITRIRHWATEHKKQQGERTTTLDANDPSDLIISALIVALKDYPNEFQQTFACLLDRRLDDATDVLSRLTTGKEEGRFLTPQVVGGVLHLLNSATFFRAPFVWGV